jgi:hypothetical protein
MGKLMKKAAAVLAAVLMMTLLAPMAGAADVCLSRQALKVNGVPVRCAAYNIDGSNYFKLRDLAMLLTDTGNRFSVDYDEAKKAVKIVTGEAYAPIGGELEEGEDFSATARPTTQRIFIDGLERADLSVYNIGGEQGSNYFKLRELGDALGFRVSYDEDSRTMLVRTCYDPGQARLPLTEDAGREYLDRITFLGECTTYGIGYYYRHGYTDLCPPAQIWTPANGTMTLAYYESARILFPGTKEEIPIAECARRAKPEILIITLGVNGLGYLDEEGFKAKFRSLVGEIRDASPATEIILNAIYPLADSWEGKSYLNNAMIDDANIWMEAVAEELGCPFLFCRESLEADGRLPEKYQNGDGLHLAGEAYSQIIAYIRTHALTGIG